MARYIQEIFRQHSKISQKELFDWYISNNTFGVKRTYESFTIFHHSVIYWFICIYLLVIIDFAIGVIISV